MTPNTEPMHLIAINSIGWQIAAWLTTNQLPNLRAKQMVKAVEGVEPTSIHFAAAERKASLSLKLLELIVEEASAGLEQLRTIMADTEGTDIECAAAQSVLMELDAEIVTIYTSLEKRLLKADLEVYSWEELPEAFIPDAIKELRGWMKQPSL